MGDWRLAALSGAVLAVAAVLEDLDLLGDDVVESDVLDAERKVSVFIPVLALPHYFICIGRYAQEI